MPGSLGRVPRPAVAASVSLAVLAEGRQPIVLPPGLAFRSAAFDDEAPQVFELDAAATIHPLNNQWPLEAPASHTLGNTDSSATQTFDQLQMTTDTSLKRDDLVLARASNRKSLNQVSTVLKVSSIT